MLLRVLQDEGRRDDKEEGQNGESGGEQAWYLCRGAQKMLADHAPRSSANTARDDAVLVPQHRASLLTPPRTPASRPICAFPHPYLLLHTDVHI